MKISSLIATAAVAPANAAIVLFSQNFDSLPQGIPAASVPGFTTTGTVDVVTNGNFGITCAGNSGACLDLDGTPGPGSVTTTSINYLGGRQVTLSFDLSGNQRDSNIDEFSWELTFGQLTDLTGFGCVSGFELAQCGSGDFNSVDRAFYIEEIAGTRPWVSYSLVFTPTAAGSLTMAFLTTSADNIGPILDNVLVTQGAVPEPASWAMLITGFGLVGAARRRQRFAAAFNAADPVRGVAGLLR